VFKFKVFAYARFLSHAETLRVFRRACSRAGLDVAYSRGYNPRPAIALPLPKSVGLACDDETCTLLLNRAGRLLDTEELKDKLNARLPEGIDLIGAQSEPRQMSFQKGTAVYELSLSPRRRGEKLQRQVAQLLAADSLMLQRRLDTLGRTRTVDVREYLQSVEVIGNKVIISARFGPQGSIRVDEMLTLLELVLEDLEGPVIRTKVLWNLILKAHN